MRPDTGWATVQIPALVSVSPNQKATYVAPVLKEEQADALRSDVEAFLRNGGQIEQVTTPHRRNGRKA